MKVLWFFQCEGHQRIFDNIHPGRWVDERMLIYNIPTQWEPWWFSLSADSSYRNLSTLLSKYDFSEASQDISSPLHNVPVMVYLGVVLNQTRSDLSSIVNLSFDFQKDLSQIVQVKANKGNISSCDSQTLILSFWA